MFCNNYEKNKSENEFYFRSGKFVQPCKVCLRLRKKKSKLFGVRRKKRLPEEKIKELRENLEDNDYIDNAINFISDRFANKIVDEFF